MANIDGNGRDNTLTGTNRADRIRGLGGDDSLFGEGGNDRLEGGDGRDRLRGGSGDDVLRGDAGNDVLMGEDGNDRLFGGGGRDRLIAGQESEEMRGGGGRDRFEFTDQGIDDRHYIFDFQDDVDELVISRQFGYRNVAQVLADAQQFGGVITIDLNSDPGPGGSERIVTLLNYTGTIQSLANDIVLV